VRGFDNRVAAVAGVPVTHVIGDDEDDVGFGGGIGGFAGLGGGRNGTREEKSQSEERALVQK